MDQLLESDPWTLYCISYDWMNLKRAMKESYSASAACFFPGAVVAGGGRFASTCASRHPKSWKTLAVDGS